VAVVVGGAVVVERVDEMSSSVVVSIGKPEKSMSWFEVVGHLVVGGGLLLKRMVLGME
jgi:hypothetical protein